MIEVSRCQPDTPDPLHRSGASIVWLVGTRRRGLPMRGIDVAAGLKNTLGVHSSGTGQFGVHSRLQPDNAR